MFNFDPIQPSKVLAHRSCGAEAFVLTVERRNEQVRAGCHVGVGLPGDETREYSVFSGEKDNFIEILVRRVAGGVVSPRLALLRPGDRVQLRRPRGGFTLAHSQPNDRLFLISTGTGVAPYVSFFRTVADLEAQVVHGVRTPDEDFSQGFIAQQNKVLCVSQPAKNTENDPIFQGRVTHWLAQQKLDLVRDRFYLCGNSAMIVEVSFFLTVAGISSDRIHAETYF